MVVRVFAMLAGIAVAAFLPLTDTVLPLLTARESWFHCGLLLVCIVVSALFKGKCSGSVFAFCAGLLYASIQAAAMFERLPWTSHEGELFEIRGVITGLPRTEFRYGKPVQRFDVQVHSSSWPVSTRPLKKLRLSWYEGKSVSAGQEWRLRVAVKRPRGFANPGSFDYQHYLHTQNIDATGTVRWGEPIAHPAGAWWAQPHAWRHRLANRLSESTRRMQQQRFLRALALGDGKALSSEDWSLLSSTGTTHLFVVSGLHIGMVAGLSYLVLLPLARVLVGALHGLSAQRLAALGSLLFAFAYSWLAGFGLPTQRAVLMLAIAVIARHFAAPFRYSQLLALAGLLIVVAEPLSIRSPGFSLSFLAVAALLYAFCHRLQSGRTVVKSMVKAQWVSFVALSSMLIFQFQTTSLLMPLANFLAIPVLSIVVLPLVMLVLFSVMLFDQVPAFALWLLDSIIRYLWQFLQWIHTHAGDVAMLQFSLSPVSLLFVGFGVLLILAPPAVRTRTAFAIPLLGLPLLNTAMSQHSTANTTQEQGSCRMAKLTVLDVGQGLAVVFAAHGKTMLYDVGARFSTDFDVGTAIVAPYLRYAGTADLDKLVVSHSDNDHAGGMSGLLENVHVATTLASYRIDGRQTVLCEAGVEWQWPAVNFSVLGPVAADSRAKKANNDQSCVLKIDTPTASVLLTGDISQKVERSLLARDASLSADIMVMPHHGSRSSSSTDFINAVAPRYAIASAGYKNRFNHPDASVVQRYHHAGVDVLNTASSGAIEFDIPLCNKQPFPKPRQYRFTADRFWLRW